MRNEYKIKYMNKINELLESEETKEIKEIKKDIKVILKNVGKLYKYLSGNDWDIKNLKNNNLIASNPSEFNDPFEFKFSLGSNLGEFKEMLKSGTFGKEGCEMVEKYEDKELINYYKATFGATRDKLIKEKNKLRVCCLSEKKDNILMWSHYANGHKGFCIEYDIEDIFKKFNGIFPVNYSEELPELENNGEKGISKYFYTKSIDWEYEDEWRLFVNYQETQESFIEMPDIKAIYMGCKIDEKLKNQLILYCGKNEIKLYQGEIGMFEYKIEFKEVNLRSR